MGQRQASRKRNAQLHDLFGEVPPIGLVDEAGSLPAVEFSQFSSIRPCARSWPMRSAASAPAASLGDLEMFKDLSLDLPQRMLAVEALPDEIGHAGSARRCSPCRRGCRTPAPGRIRRRSAARPRAPCGGTCWPCSFDRQGRVAEPVVQVQQVGRARPAAGSSSWPRPGRRPMLVSPLRNNGLVKNARPGAESRRSWRRPRGRSRRPCRRCRSAATLRPGW